MNSVAPFKPVVLNTMSTRGQGRVSDQKPVNKALNYTTRQRLYLYSPDVKPERNYVLEHDVKRKK